MPAVSGTSADRDERVPRLVKGWERRCRDVSPAEGFLLSRIDGHTPWSLLREIGGFVPSEADCCLERWLEDLIVEIRERGGTRDANRDSGPHFALAPALEASVDAELDIPVDLQRRILAIEMNLECSYHDLLGIARDAEAKDVKRAYFALSKEFHPDRYFRKEIGGFHKRLERVFKKIVEAYELLSDPATRAEIERSLGPIARDPEPRSDGDPVGTRPKGAAPAKSSRLDHLAQLRARFKIPKHVLAERKARARDFYAAFKVASARERWLEAASNARLAIAFDPAEREYKRGFGEVQRQGHRGRAQPRIQRANECLEAESAHEALRLCEEALGYRPVDADVNFNAARMAIAVGEPEQAKEYAAQAVEFGPLVCAHHALLAKALRLAGDRDGARQAVQEALRIDPRDPDARSEMDALRRVARRS